MIDIEITNIDEVIKELSVKKFTNMIDNTIQTSVFTLERTAKIHTPVVTWLLRNSYETSFSPLQWVLRNFREYAPYVEARRWFIERTVQDEETNIQNIFTRNIELYFWD